MEKKDCIRFECSKECKDLICSKCKNSNELEDLCENLLLYHYTVKNNVLWNDIIENCDCYESSKDIVYDLADCFKDNRKLYYKLKALSRGSRIAKGRECEYLKLTEMYILLEDVSDYKKSICLAVSLNYHTSNDNLTEASEAVIAIENLQKKSEFAYSMVCEYYSTIKNYKKLRKTAFDGIESYSGQDVCINYRNHLREASANIEHGGMI